MKKGFFIFVIFLSSTISAQELLPKNTIIPYSNNKYHISNEPITNREYITYLNWLESVYSSFPLLNKQVFQALPGILSDDIDKDFKNYNDFIYITAINFPTAKTASFADKKVRTKLMECNTKQIKPENFTWPNSYFYNDERRKEIYKLHKALYFSKTMSYVKDYMFNPRYIDYPVMGLSKIQALNFLKWLGDRYNESQLINKKLIYFEPYQSYENCFVTESYLCGQYATIQTKRHPENNLTWDSDLFLPSFRLPSNYELKTIGGKVEIKKYKKDKLKFLKPWMFELHKKGDDYDVIYSEYNFRSKLNLFTSNDKEFDFNYFEKEELTLNNDDNSEENNYLTLLANLGYPVISKNKYIDNEGYEIEKTAYGDMGYTIIDVNDNGELIYIDNYRAQEFYKLYKQKGGGRELYKLSINYEVEYDLRPFRFVFVGY